MTPALLRNAFVADFQELLRRYNADFHMEDHGIFHYSQMTPVIHFNWEWDVDGNTTRESSEFFLNDYV
jgi:hypothetical protein